MYRPYKIKPVVQILNFYTLFHAHYPQDYSFRGETHDFWECFFVRKGEVRVSGNERVYVLKEGELILHQPQELHRFVVTSEGGADVLTFSFDGAGALLEELKNSAFSLSDAQEGMLLPVIEAAEKEDFFCRTTAGHMKKDETAGGRADRTSEDRVLYTASFCRCMDKSGWSRRRIPEARSSFGMR
ncbi:MAG: AraC family ligand binding domain-containing protein [Eisenbergiella sp.]